MDSPDLLRQAVLSARAGDRDQARQLLARLLMDQPNHELAWLWLSDLVDSDQHRRYCLERALAINPGNTAARRRLELAPERPPSAGHVPPSPPGVRQTRASAPRRRRTLAPRPVRAAGKRYAWVAGLGALATVVLIAASSLALQLAAAPPPVALATVAPTRPTPQPATPTLIVKPAQVLPVVTPHRLVQPASTEAPPEIAALLNLTLTPTPPGDRFGIEPYLERAERYARDGKYSQAWAECGRALKVQPDHVEALYQRAALSQRLGRSSRALDDLNQAMEINPKLVKGYVLRGQVMAELLRYPEALHDFSTALALDPANAEAWCSRGAVYLQLDEDQNALLNFGQALEIRPDFAEALVGRGDAYFNLGDLTMAQVSYHKATSCTQELAPAWIGLGRVALALGNYDEAIRDLRQALVASPADEDALMYLGQAQVLDKRYTEAIATFDQAIRPATPAPKQAIMYEWRGRAYLALGRYSSAIGDLNLAIARYPSAERFYYRGLAHQAAGNLRAAQSDLKYSLESGGLDTALQQDAQERLEKLSGQ